jgi:hypothetical protein
MFYQEWNKVSDSAGIERAVLLLDHVLNLVPGHVRELLREPVHDSIQCPQLFYDSHRQSFNVLIETVKT